MYRTRSIQALKSSRGCLQGFHRAFATEKSSLYSNQKIQAMVSHNFPDFIEHWNRQRYRQVGYALIGGTGLAWATVLGGMEAISTSIILTGATTGYWMLGNADIQQSSHAIRRNFPVLGHARYLMESIRPEIRQYFVEADDEGKPYDRAHRSQIYQRAKNVNDTISLGTRLNVYNNRHEWACHSMWPIDIADMDENQRTRVGCKEYGTTQPYEASVLNISAMSYGAISDHAILALNQGAKITGCYHNTGEGGVSQFHRQGGGDLVWNVGTGYFGCGVPHPSKPGHRVFEPTIFQETLSPQIKMIEVKLSQGAKPGHGGLLPKAKITPAIAEARKLEFPPTDDCHSPARHSAFGNPVELVEFLAQLRQLSGGRPVGIKLCVGDPREVALLCRAMVDTGLGPDFITVDGAEGGTGAAPPELTNSVGLPLEEGLVLVRNLLQGASLKDQVCLNASGRITSGFSLVRTLALGADFTAAARAFMMSLGCIQALKCNTNKCPTGIATLDPDLMHGLDPQLKTTRVANYHSKTVHAAQEMVGILGKSSFGALQPDDIMRRVAADKVVTLAEQFPGAERGCLLDGKGPERLQQLWDSTAAAAMNVKSLSKRWIY